jgi:hypothetical protein
MPHEQPVIKTVLEVALDPVPGTTTSFSDPLVTLPGTPTDGQNYGLIPAIAGYVHLDKASTGV